MNHEEYVALLADYLGNELSDADRARFDAYLAENPAADAETRELRATLDELAELQTVSLPTAQVASRAAQPASRPAPTVRWLASLGKVAAILAFGVLLGRATVTPTPVTPGAGPSTGVSVAGARTPANTNPVHPGWIELAEKLDAYPESMGASLRMLANLPR